MLTLENLNLSMNMAKQALEESYEEMKSMVTPKFTKNLSDLAHRFRPFRLVYCK